MSAQMPRNVAELVDLLAAHPNGLTRPELLAALCKKYPTVRSAVIENAIRSAGDAILERDGRLFAMVRSQDEVPLELSQDHSTARPGRALRLVAFDIESVVRLTAQEPYTEPRLFQLGAVRFGLDREWSRDWRNFNAYMQLPPDAESLLEKKSVKERYLASAEPPVDVLERFREFVADADVLVAYNGTGLDFELIDKEYKRAERVLLTGQRRVDGLYLALALWPVPPRQHRLYQLIERLRIDVGDAVWHDALDDAKVLSILIEYGARFFSRWNAELQSLVATAARESDAWNVLFALMPKHPPLGTFDDADVSRILSNALRGKPPRREIRHAPDRDTYPGLPEDRRSPSQISEEPFFLPSQLCEAGVSGVVDVTLLAAARHGTGEPRQAQRDMVAAMREWVRDEVDALVEAPTGTGKSYAMLAVALEWLAAHPGNRVVISTFTKQLQMQLATDVEALGRPDVLPQLVGMTDMVKGTRNRLSLRALVIAIADLASSAPKTRIRGRADYTGDTRYRDLALYLALRLIARGEPTEEWESRSVDPFDVPAFFDEYCKKRLNLYLLSLSQALAGELDHASGDLAAHAATVRDSLARHRLIIANHALLFANVDAFAGFGEHTLLMVDEAHALENAATTALSLVVDSPAIERLAADLSDWMAEQPDRDSLGQVASTLAGLDAYLDYETLPRTVMPIFDAAGSDPLGRSYLRKVTVASPLSGSANARAIEAFGRALHDASKCVGAMRTSLRGLPPRTDIFENERFWALYNRLREMDDALNVIVRDLNAAIGFDPISPATSAANVESEVKLLTDDEEGLEETAPIDLTPAVQDEDLTPDSGLVTGEIHGHLPNRVIWAEELADSVLARSQRYYRFRVGSSPIELEHEAHYRNVSDMFSHIFYVSATLRVADGWKFIRERLALAENKVKAISLDSPFDAATQARLVCFDDFPSWAEQADGAMRTIAHQLDGYAREVIKNERHGAMVLTTAKASAAGIADALVRLRARHGSTYRITSTELLGNQRAVDTFREVGGALVGTKGLWQGVDIDNAERLRLVWINKLPFASFTDPVIAARQALVRDRAEAQGHVDPEAYANETYYLPLAAIELRQAVGRLIRTREHRGVVIISDRKLAGPTRLRRLYRQVFLGSLDPGLLLGDPETGEKAAGNVVPMAEGWRRIWQFFAAEGIIDAARAAELMVDDALDEFTQLPQTRAIRRATFTPEQEADLRAQGPDVFAEALLERAAQIGGYLKLQEKPADLRDKQKEAIDALARGKDLLAVLPTGYGKSFVYQLPALALPGVTIVVSPLVSLMTDQALELNKTIGGAVRALVAPMRESNSRTGKVEVHQQLTDPNCRHGIRIIYLSPERLCQRQFQDWIRSSVKQGIVRRIAIDEAHTFVQWGDDFRPSFRRGEQFLRALKQDCPELQLIALTATANKPVRDGLRRAIFGLEPEAANPSTLAYVYANPIRPELAIYRRTLGPREGSHVAVSGLIERVVDKLNDGHAILYCLTVKEVDAIYVQLRAYLGDQSDRVRRYHGRLTEVEKTSVANDFKNAPKKGEEGFRPMIVVATSAFGLGIDRPDIRTVFVVSPPTDLAALYQQLGRAGRDQVGLRAETRTRTIGLALATNKAFRTIHFMTQRASDPELLVRMAATILNSDSPLDMRQIARDLVAEDYGAGKLKNEQAADRNTEDQYHITVTRVLAELSGACLVEDLGDFPTLVDIRPGEVWADTPEMVEIVNAILSAPPAELRSVDLGKLYERLVRNFGDELPDHGALWSLILNLHTLGYLEVSQMPNAGRGYRTAVRIHGGTLPEGFIEKLGQRRRTIDAEFHDLVAWYKSQECANEGLRHYFGARELPTETCKTANCRCSTCWRQADLIRPDDEEPPLLEAFGTFNPRPAAATGEPRKRTQNRLDRYVEQLLWHNYNGLGEYLIWAVLKGDEFYFNTRTQRREKLWPRLLNNSVHNARPGLRREELRASLERLENQGVIMREGGFWRLVRHMTKNAGQVTEVIDRHDLMPRADGPVPEAAI